MKTDDDLKAAFAGESQANRKYTAYSRKAELDGFPNVARLFRAAAEAETVHALNHLRTMKGVKSTIDNLNDALQGEVHEHTKMYPDFIKDSEGDNRTDARITFNYANEVEKIHAKFYQEAINSVQAGKDIQDNEFFVCGGCGYTASGEAPDQCPVCGAAKSQFKRIA